MTKIALSFAPKRQIFLWPLMLVLIGFLIGNTSSSPPNEWVPRRMPQNMINDGRRKKSGIHPKHTFTSGPVAFPASRQTNQKRDSQQSMKSKMWPPWPFNLLSQPRENMEDSQSSGVQQTQETSYRSTAQIFWAYFRQRARIGARQVQQVGSDLWFNLPPAAPPLLLLAAIPRRVTTGEVTSRMPPLFGNPFARSLALGYLGVAILSWSHSELNRKRRLVPLPLMDQYQDVARAILPHFLPEEIPDMETEELLVDAEEDDVVQTISKEQRVSEEVEEIATLKGFPSVPPRLRRQLQSFYDAAPRPQTFGSTIREWGKLRQSRRLSEEKIRRKVIMNELIALKSLKKKSKRKKGDGVRTEASNSSTKSDTPLGYALVTGASRGIGRAIAVELARWEIPLILVARDLDRLTEVADEIETCYGVRCCVLQADLSEQDAAERIHQTTRDAGLRVDILVNNAGICTTGLSVDMPSSDVRQMIQVNAMSVAMLNHLYGRDMKDQGRGRILVVSSVVGCAPGGPQVAMYTATKAFEKNLALSMGKELEPYGVGVTCLMPGAVRDTAFQSKSGSSEALCWSLPFYTRTAPTVAHEGVRAMLLGQTEVSPGWQNRAFVKLMTPMLPQRLTTLVVESAWTPFKWPRGQNGQKRASGGKDTETQSAPVQAVEEAEVPSFWWGSNPSSTPRVLALSPGAGTITTQADDLEEPDTEILPHDSKPTEASTEIVEHPHNEVREHHHDESYQNSVPRITTTIHEEPLHNSTTDHEPSSIGSDSQNISGQQEQTEEKYPAVEEWGATKEKIVSSFPAVDDWDDAEEHLEEWARQDAQTVPLLDNS